MVARSCLTSSTPTTTSSPSPAATQQVYADESAKNPAFKKIYTEWEKYRKTQNAWFSVAEMRMDRFLQSHK